MSRATRRPGVTAALVLAAVSMSAQSPRPTEYQVKAAYLYNFGRFVRWPADAAGTETFSICVLGRDPFGAALDVAIAGVTIEGKRAIARRVDQPQDAAACRIVFVSTSEDQQLSRVLAVLERTRALTVSDMPDFTRRGGMIQFVDDGNRVRFDVNLGSAETAGLELSSELLKVAVGVRRSRRSGT